MRLKGAGVPFRSICGRLLVVIFTIALLPAPSSSSGLHSSEAPSISADISGHPHSVFGNRQLAAGVRRPQLAIFSVVIDPAHGGSDFGARIAANVLEKDLSLTLARKLRQELQSRHIAAVLLRDGDADLSFDQRALNANLARPSAYICIHAEPGSTLRIYTSAATLAAPRVPDRNGFLPWQSAQKAFQADSLAFATTAAASISKRELAAPIQPAFLRPLHSIAAPAIAIEVPAGKKGFRISPDLIAGALADAIATRKLSSGAAR
jgi:N-acetylmuramoyl-L-alanine amidase